jgi:spermidine synthase
MLSAVLLPLAVSAHGVRIFQKLKIQPSMLLMAGGILTLTIGPMIERLDMLSSVYAIDRNLSKFFLALAIVGPVTVVLGGVFPQLLEEVNGARDWSRIHAVNTLGAILGSITAAWIALPSVGLAGSVLIISGVLFSVGCAMGGARGIPKCNALISVIVIFVIALINTKIIASEHVLGAKNSGLSTYSVVEYRETPDYSIAVIAYDHKRALFIDGFSASADLGGNDYMIWMGRLPMLMHPDPRNALVICFGRGVTADSVRQEGVDHLDIVDISKTVFDMGRFFTHDNHNILDDPRVNPVSMDGRAWLRRTSALYDVITLEPMPPTFSGVNNLYSKEFYELARDRLTKDGTLAQWLPFHLLTPEQSKAIARTFSSVFPNSVLWLFEPYHTGILVGKKENSGDIKFFRLEEKMDTRELTTNQIQESIKLRGEQILNFGAEAPIISDNNQYLSFGWESLKNDLSYNDSLRYESEVFKLILSAQKR